MPHSVADSGICRNRGKAAFPILEARAVRRCRLQKRLTPRGHDSVCANRRVRHRPARSFRFARQDGPSARSHRKGARHRLMSTADRGGRLPRPVRKPLGKQDTMRRVLLAVSIASAVVGTSARAECDASSTGVSKSTDCEGNGTARSAAPTGGAGTQAPVKTQPLSRPQVRLAGYDLHIRRA